MNVPQGHLPDLATVCHGAVSDVQRRPGGVLCRCKISIANFQSHVSDVLKKVTSPFVANEVAHFLCVRAATRCRDVEKGGTDVVQRVATTFFLQFDAPHELDVQEPLPPTEPGPACETPCDNTHTVMRSEKSFG